MIIIRKELEKIEEVRDTFTGIFNRFGVKNGYMNIEKTILLTNIKDKNNNIVSDHLWFNYTKSFQNIEPLIEGDLIEFHARSKPYIKGYRGYKNNMFDKPMELDYKLSYPTKIKKINLTK